MSILVTYARLAVSAAGAMALAALDPAPLPRARPARAAYHPSPAARRLVQARATGHPSAGVVAGTRVPTRSSAGSPPAGIATATLDTSGWGRTGTGTGSERLAS